MTFFFSNYVTGHAVEVLRVVSLKTFHSLLKIKRMVERNHLMATINFPKILVFLVA